MKKILILCCIILSLTSYSQALEIWPIANEGVMIKVGDQQVINDGIFKSTYPKFASTPQHVFEKLQNSSAPYDDVELILASHKHSDHFSVAEIASVLDNTKQTRLYINEEMAEEMKGSVKWEKIKNKMIEFPYGKETTYNLKDISVPTFPILHARKTASEMKNPSHLIEINGYRVMHVGDATYGQQDLVDLNLGDLDLDILILPYWFVRDTDGQTYISENLPARKHYINHIPPAELKNVLDLLAGKRDMVVMGEDVFQVEK